MSAMIQINILKKKVRELTAENEELRRELNEHRKATDE